MKYLPLILFACIFSTGCFTVTLQDGRNARFNNLAKDEATNKPLDTSKFIKQPFRATDYINNVATINNKRVIVPVRGRDVKTLAAIDGKYYICFWNPTCPASVPKLKRIDSLCRAGINILLVSERMEYEHINKRLSSTKLAKYPMYTIETEDYTDFLLWRQIGFTQEACPECYKDLPEKHLSVTSILVENGQVRFIAYNSPDNIFR